MKARTFWIFLIAPVLTLFFSLPSHAIELDDSANRDAVARFENRLNELMLWRLSDELGLKPQEEQKLKAILRKYQDQRKSSLTKKEDAVTKMGAAEKSVPAKVCPECLGEYDQAIALMANANTSEFKELKTLLGPARTQKFLVIRSQMTKDVQEALRQPATPPPPAPPAQK